MQNVKRLGYIAAIIGAVCVFVGMAVLKTENKDIEPLTFEKAGSVIINAEYAETEFFNTESGIKIEFVTEHEGDYGARSENGVLYVDCIPDLPWYRKAASCVFGTGVKVRIGLPEDYSGSVFTKDKDGKIVPANAG